MYKTVLVPIDLNDDDSWAKALPVAIECARLFQATLHFITVVPDFGMSVVAQQFPKNYAKKALDEIDKRLAAFRKEHVPEGIEAHHIVVQGSVDDGILHAANEIDADLVVMAAHKPGIQDYLLGINAYRVVRHFSGSVLVVRD